MKKRLFSLALALLTICSAAACGGGGSTTVPPAESGSQTETAAPATTEAKEVLGIPDTLRYSGEKVTLYTEGYLSEDFSYFYLPEDESGEVVNDAAAQRTRALEERLNVNLEYSAQARGNVNAYRASVQAGDGAYDLVSAIVNYMTPCVAAGECADLYGYPVVDTERSWYLPYVNAELEIEDALYLVCGYFDMATLARTSCVFFSPKVAEDNKLGDLYDYVLKDTWNYDTMLSLAEKCAADVNGDGTWDEKDRYGLCGGYNMNSMLIIATGYHFTKLENDARVISGINDKIVNFNKMLYETYAKTWYYNCYPYGGKNGFADAAKRFEQDAYLFFLQDVSYAKDFAGEMEAYGILPIPKYGADQAEFFSYCRPTTTSIPADAKNPELSATVLEALNYYSREILLPAYYEIALSSRYASTPEASQMLDIVFANAAVDFAQLWYTNLKISPNLHNSIGVMEDYVSWYESIRGTFTTNLAALLESVAAVQEANRKK